MTSQAVRPTSSPGPVLSVGRLLPCLAAVNGDPQFGITFVISGDSRLSQWIQRYAFQFLPAILSEIGRSKVPKVGHLALSILERGAALSLNRIL